jgi:hypothetical protein
VIGQGSRDGAPFYLRCIFCRVSSRDHFCGRHDGQTRAEYRGQCFGDEGRLILAYKHDAEHFAAAPDDFASLADKRMRYGRKSKPAPDRDADLSDELRAVQRHIQNLTLVANEIIVEREPRSVLPRSSMFTFLLCDEHQNALPW